MELLDNILAFIKKIKISPMTARYVKYIAYVLMVFIGIVIGLFWFYKDELPPMSELQHYTMRTGSEVYDRNGKLFHMFAFEQRKMVNLKELPPYVPDALIALEDKHFYHHFGIDLIGTTRAFLVDIFRGSFSQGASTITQQLARNMFLTLDKQLPRKIKEALLSFRIESNFSKDEILEMYFNKIYFGNGVYGIETASLYYFGKHAHNLSLPEAATLVGMVQRPNYFDPQRFPDRAINRRNLVLKRMLAERKITKEEYQEAYVAPLISNESILGDEAADYFLEYIRLYLEKKYGTKKLFEGGLKIYTTIDFDLTQYSDSMLNLQLTRMEEREGMWFRYKKYDQKASNIATPYLQGGVLTMDNRTGYVRVMIGGRNFNHSKFNRIMMARRQPGSAFKPILYTAAVEKGYTPATVIRDEPMIFYLSDGTTWEPHNYNKGEYYGLTRMREAITRSQNMWAVKTVYDIGVSSTISAAYRFGLTTPQLPTFSLALGSSEVIPIELISGFTAFPNNGYRVKPIFITRVEDKKGKVLERAHEERKLVCDSKVAYTLTSMMQSVIDSGTATVARSQGYIWPAAGKTGTTDDYRDAWFIGFNREMITGVWMGFDNNQSMGSGMAGGVACAPVWPYIMRRAITNENGGRRPAINDKRYAFEVPDGMVTASINPTTGFLSKNPENGLNEIFISGMEPKVASDSLLYNFYPTRYRLHDRSPYIVYENGK
ncbi:MAG TPA: PBP1A family penicillin-binding protein [Candidatus Cloacimonadota bacterium]|nr:PBP1A family penicillin-binding protein [Candidatus Cloacimonadota bacterium]HPT71095.1 PBP1A family penicillin-binding protein [Candidatus Cloacimonadota bacterium]